MRITPLNGYTAGPSYARKPRLTKAELQHRMARQAAIDRAKARYIKMICGHYTTLEEDERDSHWRPKPGVSWCGGYGKCNAWVQIYVYRPVVNDNDQPMF